MIKKLLDKFSLSGIVSSATNRIVDQKLLFIIVVTGLLEILLLSGVDVPLRLLPIAYALPIIALIAIILKASDLERKAYIEDLGINESETHVKIVPILEKSKKIRLLGTGLCIIQNPNLLQKIMKKTREENVTLEILLANPFSHDVKSRLIEEEMGEEKPHVGRQGIINIINMVLMERDAQGNKENVTLRLFSNYPTFAIMVLDDHYYFYPYAYKKLGNYSHIFHFVEESRNCTPLIKFIESQYTRIYNDSLDLAGVGSFDATIHRRLQKKQAADNDKWYAYALYYIPDENSRIYTFGSTIVGYDIRSKIHTNSVYKNYTGAAKYYGFHLTICDALYFKNQAWLDRAIKETEFLAEEFMPFDLTNVRLLESFPNQTAVSIGCTDESGGLEALHHELVSKVYRTASGSNYTRDKALLDRTAPSDRTNLMLTYYNAPYILKQFRPHFTLLSNVPDEKQHEMKLMLENDFSNARVEQRLHVDKLAIMTCGRPEIASDAPQWKIVKEIQLGKRL
ncbi:MAG: DUF1045 domain-containing protein [Chitinivibrionales bacterium]|nr:DUF1045 domain-containing protein [Chitinivibrionales bacterium]